MGGSWNRASLTLVRCKLQNSINFKYIVVTKMSHLHIVELHETSDLVSTKCPKVYSTAQVHSILVFTCIEGYFKKCLSLKEELLSLRLAQFLKSSERLNRRITLQETLPLCQMQKLLFLVGRHLFFDLFHSSYLCDANLVAKDRTLRSVNRASLKRRQHPCYMRLKRYFPLVGMNGIEYYRFAMNSGLRLAIQLKEYDEIFYVCINRIFPKAARLYRRIFA